MGFFNKKKKADDIPVQTPDPVEQVFGAAPKKPAEPPVKVTVVTPKPTPQPAPKPAAKPPVKQAPTRGYGYGPEEADFYDPYGPTELPNIPSSQTEPYRGPATPLKPGEKPEPWYKTYTPKPLYDKRSAIILVVEASEDTIRYKAEIARLINKIVTDNKDEFFMFIRFGNATKYSELIRGDKLADKDVTTNLLSYEADAENKFDIYAALKHIDSFIREYITLYKTFELDVKQYMIDDARIIFIGTAKTDECKHNPRILLRTLCKNKKIKAVKYFCLKDEHTIKAAALGFPVIGHIESNFYK